MLIFNAVDESDDGRLWNDAEEGGNGRRVRKMKALAVKTETLTLVNSVNLPCQQSFLTHINNIIQT